MARSTRLRENKLDYKPFFAKSFTKTGEKWHLVSVDWLNKLNDYYEGKSGNILGENPGPIDNSSLLYGTRTLKHGLLEDKHYKLANEDDWTKLIEFYGIVDKQHDISREVIDFNQNSSSAKQDLFLDIYPLDLKLAKFPFNSHQVVNQGYSKFDLLSKIETDMRNIFSEDSETNVRLWKADDLANIDTFFPLPDKCVTLFNAGLVDQFVVMECNNKLTDKKWPLSVKHPHFQKFNAQFNVYENNSDDSEDETNGGTSNTSYNNYLNNDHESKNLVPGLSGCINLGNTCFMNSALQCLSNVPPLTEYFVSKKFLQDINQNNPLGMKGMIAKSYARLMESIWANKNCSSQLRAFKEIVSEFAPMFSGYQQHDSQELLIFLLDGLHEDLNRVKKKPYVELKEAEGRRDEEVAKEAWSHFKLRNDSIIVDTFYGQLKSTLVCPICSKVSVTFDPFSTLSVPLPYKKERTLKVKMAPYDPDKKPVQCRINVPKNGTISDLCAVINNLAGIPLNQILVSKITLNRFHKVFNSHESISFINPNDDIVIYEVPMVPEKGMICLPVYQRVDKSYFNNPSSNDVPSESSSTQIHSANFFVPPFIVVAPLNKTNERNIRKLLMEKMRRYVTIPGPNDEWWILKTKVPNFLSMAEYSLKNPPALFSIKVGNIYGNVDFTLKEPEDIAALQEKTTEVNGINTQEKYGTKVEPSSFLILDWNPIAKAKFFDIENALDIIVHDNILTATNYLNSNNNRTPTSSPGAGSSNNNSENSVDGNRSSSTPLNKRQCELTDCLDSFVSTERLAAEDSWYCPSCKKHQQATKKFDLWKLPPILIIHLKRFYYSRFFREKINLTVDFPINNLDLSSYVKNKDEKNKCVYNLISVSNHYGELGYGHYTAFAKNYFSKKWYNFDDSHVLTIKETDVTSSSAYVLFYQREGTENLFFSPSSICSSTFSTFDSVFTNPSLFDETTHHANQSNHVSHNNNSSRSGVTTRSGMNTDDEMTVVMNEPKTDDHENCEASEMLPPPPPRQRSKNKIVREGGGDPSNAKCPAESSVSSVPPPAATPNIDPTYGDDDDYFMEDSTNSATCDDENENVEVDRHEDNAIGETGEIAVKKCGKSLIIKPKLVIKAEERQDMIRDEGEKTQSIQQQNPNPNINNFPNKNVNKSSPVLSSSPPGNAKVHNGK